VGLLSVEASRSLPRREVVVIVSQSGETLIEAENLVLNKIRRQRVELRKGLVSTVVRKDLCPGH